MTNFLLSLFFCYCLDKVYRSSYTKSDVVNQFRDRGVRVGGGGGGGETTRSFSLGVFIGSSQYGFGMTQSFIVFDSGQARGLAPTK